MHHSFHCVWMVTNIIESFGVLEMASASIKCILTCTQTNIDIQFHTNLDPVGNSPWRTVIQSLFSKLKSSCREKSISTQNNKPGKDQPVVRHNINHTRQSLTMNCPVTNK